MDIVLIDAPCTGSGTWRRRPDAKWRLTQKQLDVRIAEQAAILDAAKAFVKPGGTTRLHHLFGLRSRKTPARSRHSWRANQDFRAARSRELCGTTSFPGKAGTARIDGGRRHFAFAGQKRHRRIFFAALSRKT